MISDSQACVLHAIAGGAVCRENDNYRAAMKIDGAYVAWQTLQWAIDKGMIQREHNNDRYLITDAGCAALAEYDAARRETA